jgi:hypothetical protein
MLATENKPLRPSDEIQLAEDLADYALKPLTPGTYQVTVLCAQAGGTYRSEPQTLQVTSPRVEALAQTGDPRYGRLALAFTHRAGDGRFTVYERVNESFWPEIGICYPRYTAPAGRRITSVAVAATVVSAEESRLLAWLEEDVLYAAVGWGKTVIMIPSRLTIGLKSSRLVGTGWQLANSDGLFLLLGMENGRAKLGLASFFNKGSQSRMRTFDLAAALPEFVQACYIPQQGRSKIQVVWGEFLNGVSRIKTREIPVGLGALRPASIVDVMERPEPLVALAMDPVAGEGVSVVQALFGPGKGDGTLTYVEIPLRAGKPKTWSLESPTPTPDAWAIAGAADGGHAVFVRSGDRLLFNRIGNPAGWQVIAENARATNFLGLQNMNELWATWVDPRLGLQWRSLPEPGR